MEYTFDTKDKNLTTVLVNKYSMPCDSKGYIMWNPKYGNIPEDTKEYIKYIFSLPQNINYNTFEDVVTVLQLRHMAATSSIRNLEYANLSEEAKYSLIHRLEKIVNHSEELIKIFKQKMGLARFEAMKMIKITDIYNYFK